MWLVSLHRVISDQEMGQCNDVTYLPTDIRYWRLQRDAILALEFFDYKLVYTS